MALQAMSNEYTKAEMEAAERFVEWECEHAGNHIHNGICLPCLATFRREALEEGYGGGYSDGFDQGRYDGQDEGFRACREKAATEAEGWADGFHIASAIRALEPDA